MGPFGMMDLFGLDLVITGWRRPSDDPVREAVRAKVEPLLAGYVDAGDLGMKSGRGFYDYPEPAYQDPAFLTAAPIDQTTSDALTTTLVCGAVDLAALGVASTDDIDLAWTAATGLAIGPFGILDQLGPDRLRGMLDAHVRLGLITRSAADDIEGFTG
jgi:3-hydroxybutyryl-CoA dehydrogenase